MILRVRTLLISYAKEFKINHGSTPPNNLFMIGYVKIVSIEKPSSGVDILLASESHRSSDLRYLLRGDSPAN